jgi:hypothetical protein
MITGCWRANDAAWESKRHSSNVKGKTKCEFEEGIETEVLYDLSAVY